jgi:hypothetical protein
LLVAKGIDSLSSHPSWPLGNINQTYWFDYTLLISNLITFFLYLWPNRLTLLSIIMTTLLLLAPPFLFFDSVFYAKFLRSIGYGGGIEVTVLLNEKNINKQEFKTKLLMRTSTFVTLYDSHSQSISEIPINRIQSIRHDPLYSVRYQLPSR